MKTLEYREPIIRESSVPVWRPERPWREPSSAYFKVRFRNKEYLYDRKEYSPLEANLDAFLRSLEAYLGGQR